MTAFSAYFVNVRLFRSSESGLATLRLKAFRHIHDLAMLTQNTERRGSLVSRVTSDVDTISMFVQFGGLMLMINVAQITLATVLMVVYSPLLGLVVWLCFVPLFVIIRKFQGIVGRAYTTVRERVGDMLGAISEAVVGAQAIRAYGVEDRTAERIDAAVENHRKAAIGAQARSVMAFTSGQLVSGLTTAVVLVVGTVLAADGSLTLGELLAFLFLVNLFTMPVQQATEILNEMQNAVAGWRRVIGIIDTPADVVRPRRRGVTLPARTDHRAVRRGRLRLPRRRARAPRHRPGHRAAHPRRHRRRDRVGQVDARQAAHPAHGLQQRAGPPRRRRPAHDPLLLAAVPRRARAAGGLPLRRHPARQHPLRPAAGERARRPAHPHRARPRPVGLDPAARPGHRRRASAASPSRPASASSSPWPAPTLPTPTCSSSTRRRRPSTRAPRCGSSAPSTR